MAIARQPEQLHALIKPYLETAKAVRLDVTVFQDKQAAVDIAIATFGRIDVLVSNAGHGLIAALEESSDVAHIPPFPLAQENYYCFNSASSTVDR